MKHSRRFALRLALAATTLAGLHAGAAAQSAATATYPSKPIRLVVPFPAGGGADTIGRIIAKPLSQVLGQPVVVENKPGASGLTGNDMVAKSPADGHTLLIGITSMIQAPALYSKVPYDVLKDLAPVTQVATSSDLFMVRSELPVQTLQEYITLVKSQPGKHTNGNYGNGTSSHLHSEMLKLATGIDLVNVPFKGAAPVVTDLLGGHLSSAFIDTSSANAYLKSDKIRILGITGMKRHPALPAVPTLAELGLKGFESNGWYGVFAPGGTPKPVVDKLAAEIRNIVNSPEVQGRLISMGLGPVGSTPEELATIMARDMPRWAAIVKDARIRMD